MITTQVTEVTRGNVVDVLKSAMDIHEPNSFEIDYLYKYYRGRQPILSRVKTIRPEINNMIVENHAFEIVAFKTGYVFGEPVMYVSRSDKSGLSDKINQLNELMFGADKDEKDKELAEWFNTCGTGYRMVLPSLDDIGFEIDNLDPRNTFVVYNTGFGRKPVMGVTYTELDDKSKRYSIYTPAVYFEVLDDNIISEIPHALGSIPIIEYPANNARLGSFEVVLGLLDALNNSASNRMDGIEQFIQAFIKFVNCDIDTETFAALKDMGAIKIKGEPGNPADVDIVAKELDQSQVQVQIDHMYQMVLTICGMPDRNGANRTTGDTGQAVILRDGWSAAEARARDTELIFKKAEKQILRLVLRILRDSSGLDLSLGDLDIKFTRKNSDNLLVKTQGLQNMLEAGVHPAIAITNSGLFSDPEQTYVDSMPYLEKWKVKSVQPDTVNVGGDDAA